MKNFFKWDFFHVALIFILTLFPAFGWVIPVSWLHYVLYKEGNKGQVVHKIISEMSETLLSK